MNRLKLTSRRTVLGLMSGTALALAFSPVSAQDAVVEEMVIGREDAPITIIEYASFTCPHCATFHHEVFPELKANYIDTGKVRFIYRPVYFDGPGLWADMVARCGGTEKYFGITSLLFERQSEWSRADSAAGVAQGLQSIGRQAGLDGATVEACLQDNDYAKTLVGAFQENATRDGVTATPSFLIDGVMTSNMSYATFSQLLDEKLGE